MLLACSCRVPVPGSSRLVEAMKHKLNLNGPALRIVATIALFLVVVPALLYLSTPACRAFRIAATGQRLLMRASLAVGALLAALFAALIVIEGIQDRQTDRVYRRNRHRALRLAGGHCECQYCGNRWVREADSHCSVCGRALTPGP